ncbi:putative Galactose-binding-like domain superfamily [Plasmopara halstedii]
MAWHGAEVSLKLMHGPLWLRFPFFNILNQSEARMEKQISSLYFNSLRFADLRMQIRHKLKELPQPPQFEASMVYWDILDLFDEYLPLLIAIQRFHVLKYNDNATPPKLLTIFFPLFYGFDEINMLSDQNVWMQQRPSYWIAVELVLLLWSMEGELYNLSRLQHAELSWQSAVSFYRRAAKVSIRNKERIERSDLQKRLDWKLFDVVAISAASLARMYSTHLLSTHLSCMTLMKIQPRQMFRIGSVLARRSLALLCEATSYQVFQNAPSLFDKLQWCLNAYKIRWRAIYYQNELANYRSSANFEIAIHFCEKLLKLRIAEFPATLSSLCCAQFAQEIQQKHRAHLALALDVKRTLLSDYRERFGMIRVIKTLDIDLLNIQEAEPILSEVQDVLYGSEDEDSASNHVSHYLVEKIIENVERANLRTIAVNTESFMPNEGDGVITENQKVETCQDVKSKYIKPRNKSMSTFCRLKQKCPATCKQVKQGGTNPKYHDSGRVTTTCGGKHLHLKKILNLPRANEGVKIWGNAPSTGDRHFDTSSSSEKPQLKMRPSSYCGFTDTKTVERNYDSERRRFPCALCEQRYMRSSLSGVAVMKQVYDLRRKWGIIQDSPKLNNPSVLYGTAKVCLQCLEILTHEKSEHLSRNAHRNSKVCKMELSAAIDKTDKGEGITRMIHDSILYQWHQHSPRHIFEESLEDIAVNKTVHQSSTFDSTKAQNALIQDSNSYIRTKDEFQSWWEIDLASYVEVHSVKIRFQRSSHSFPIHICILTNSGIGRNFADIIGDCVSFKSIIDDTGSLIEFVAPPKSKGRFIRVQCECDAALHIERVHVYVHKAVSDPIERHHNYCESTINSTQDPVKLKSKQTKKMVVASGMRCASTVSKATESLHDDPTSTFGSQDKKSISRLYARFKGLLDARARYITPE